MSSEKAAPSRATYTTSDFTDAQIMAMKKRFDALFKGPQIAPQIFVVSKKFKDKLREYLKRVDEENESGNNKIKKDPL